MSEDQSDGLGPISVPAVSTTPATDGRNHRANDMWVAVPTRTYDHMAKVARDARDLLGALHANVDGLRAGFGDAKSPANIAQGLSAIDACCERLNNILEDALIGARREGLTLQRASLSLASVVATALRQVRTSAEAKQVSFSVVTELDVAARLDRTLLTRALVKLMDRIIRESDAGSEIAVHYRLESGQVGISFFSKASHQGAFVATAPIWAAEPARDGAETPSRADADSELEFCHLVAECHGGTLTIGSADRAGAAALYRIDLPWVA